MVPRAEVEKMVAAAVTQAQESTMDLLERRRLTAEIIKAQVSAGMIKEEDQPALTEKLQQKSADALKDDLTLLEKMQDALKASGEDAVNKFKESMIPAEGTHIGGFTVGLLRMEGVAERQFVI